MTTNKRVNRYRLTLELLADKNGDNSVQKHLETEVENHDELFDIVSKVTDKNLFGNNKDQSIQFALGLKLLGEVIINNRDHSLFENFAPAFKELMMTLKKS